MRELLLVGVGAGNPDHLTLEGAKALREADLVLIPRKGPEKAELADLRREILERALAGEPAEVAEFDLPVRRKDGDYLDGVEEWHDAIATAWRAAMATRPGAARVALLIWGDPSLYDSSLRIAGRLAPPAVRVVPGITALQALTAAHRITLAGLGEPAVITTGRRLREEGWPPGADTAAVMLDGACAFRTLPPEGFDIWWGACLGMEDEILIAGPLAEAGPRIVEERAAARARRGWIMDIYILRKRREPTVSWLRNTNEAD
ncbi:MAG: precorrin-6A synthase (deacetylating) [Pikeienuella sp.]